MKDEQIGDFAKRLLDYLTLKRIENEITPEKPLKASEVVKMATRFVLSDADVRAAVHLLRTRDNPIASSSTGYFYALSVEEMKHTDADLSSRAFSILEARAGVRRWMRRKTEAKHQIPIATEEIAQ